MLPHLAGVRTALVVGEGDGRFLIDFLSANPVVRVDCVDLSPAMIDLARRRVATVPGGSDRVTFYVGDVRDWPIPARTYDAVVTNFVLDCFSENELATVMNRLASATDRGTSWIVGDFARPKAVWARWPAGSLLWTMYLFFRIATGLRTRRLVDPAPLLRSHGFETRHEWSALRGFLSSRLWVRT
jgi:SAM-dependent methyltransferase